MQRIRRPRALVTHRTAWAVTAVVLSLLAAAGGLAVPAQAAAGVEPATTRDGPKIAPNRFAGPQTGVNCVDGDPRYRVQVVYAHAVDDPNRLAAVRGRIEVAAVQADWEFLRSSLFHGARQQLRWVTDADCRPRIATATYDAATITDFWQWLASLRGQDVTLTDPAMRYLVFTDGESWPCGQAMVDHMHPGVSDVPGQENVNNGNALTVARVMLPCWDNEEGTATAHELMHSLGAVQDSAPGANGEGHCGTSDDTMCRSDGKLPATWCPQQARYAWLFDCRGTAYYNPHPVPGSYLATHWNTASSRFLQAPSGPSVTVHAPAGRRVRVTADVHVPSGQGWSLQWVTTGACRSDTARSTSSDGPRPAATLTCTGPGDLAAVVTVADRTRVVAGLTRTDAAAPLTVTTPPARLPAGRPATLTAHTAPGRTVQALSGDTVLAAADADGSGTAVLRLPAATVGQIVVAAGPDAQDRAVVLLRRALRGWKETTADAAGVTVRTRVPWSGPLMDDFDPATYVLERRTGGRWTPAGSVTSAEGRYTVRFPLPGDAPWRVRAWSHRLGGWLTERPDRP